jgi:hypothetical protein
MKTIKKIIQTGFIILFIVTILSPVQAGTFDGNTLVMSCEKALKALDGKYMAESKDSFDAGMCVGNLMGFIGGWSASSQVDPRSRGRTPWCLPERFNWKQLVKIVLKYYDENPEKLHFNYDAQVMKILIRTFPCKV